MLKPHKAIWRSIRKSFDFRGRSRRSEFWWLHGILLLLGLLFIFVDDWIVPEAVGDPDLYWIKGWLADWQNYPLTNIFYYLTLPATLAVCARRLHDIGRRAWPVIPYALASELLDVMPPYRPENAFGFVDISEPSQMLAYVQDNLVIFIIIAVYALFSLYILLCAIFDSHVADNKYGPSPKHGSQTAVFD